jgi:subtilisin family serine protease
MSASPLDGGLSPRLAELAKPSVRALPPARQARALGVVRRGPGGLLREGNRVLVQVRFEHGAAAGLDALRAAGAKVVNLSRRYQTVTVAVRPGDLRDVSAVPRVAGVKEVLAPLVYASECPSGEIVSEGDVQLRAEEARAKYEVGGEGITVGILSDSFDKATEAADGSGPIATKAEDDVLRGDLPGTGNTCGDTTPVDVLEDLEPKEPEEGADEGRAMAQIVHDLAPKADIAFATAFNGLFGFAENIEQLARPEVSEGGGAEVIADDVGYFEEPFFQEGPAAVAVGNVTAEGVTYFSAAGNDNLFDAEGREIASWEAPSFRDSGGCPAPLVALSAAVEEEEGEGFGLNAHHCLDFDPGMGVDRTFGITVEEGETLIADLQWAEPWNGVGTDIDAYLFDSEGSLVGFSVDDNVNGTQQPFELIGGENLGADQQLQLVINRYSGGLPRLKVALLENGRGVSATEYPESRGGDIVGPTIFGHSGARDAVSVAAVRYDTKSEPERYSSRGPVTHYFGPVEGTEAADPLPSPETLSKPDLAATDCGVTNFFARQTESGDWRFCGTSAAAPHAAAVAALALDAVEGATPAEVREAEVNSALSVAPFGSCAAGGGLLDAVATIEALDSAEPGPPPPPCIPPASPPIPLPPSTSTLTTVAPKPPNTFFRKRPRRVLRTRGRRARAVFRFGSSAAGATFQCKVGRRPFRGCRSRFVRRFGVGRHVVRVRARDSEGRLDPTPALWRFRVERVGARVRHRVGHRHIRRGTAT